MGNDYIPYGPEWAKEIKKMPKEIIIKLLAEANIKRKEAEKKAAAAPDLLEALEGLLGCGRKDLSGDKYEGYFDAARAAIAKATTINQ